MNNSEAGLQHPESHWADLPHDPEAEYEDEEDSGEEEARREATVETQNTLPLNPEIDIEFGTLAVGTWFTTDTNGATFEKTSDREARIVVGNVRLLSIPSQFGLRKPVRVVPRKGEPFFKG